MTPRRLVLAAVLALCAGQAHAQTSPLNGWTLSFSDEFEGSSVDTSKWNITNEPGQFNNESQFYTPANVTSANGRLTLKSEQRPIGGRQYASGKVTTLNKFAQQFGRFEMRARLPKTQGIWPAFWMLPTTGAWPPEIDIMEMLGHDPFRVYVTNHWGIFPSAYSYNTTPVPGPIDYSATFNTFEVNWDQGRLEFYINGVKRATHTGGVPSEPFYLILNTAVGGNWPGYPDATTVFPQTFDVEYVRAYRRTLFNATFDNMGPSGNSPLDGWTGFGSRFAETAFSRSGARSCKLFGPFVPGGGVSGVYQETPVKPGQVWRASAWWFTPSSDQMRGANTTQTRIEWRDAAGNLISTSSAPGLAGNSPPNVWTRSLIEAAAPANAAKARLVHIFIQPGLEPGAAYVDDSDLQLQLSNPGFEQVSGTPLSLSDWTPAGVAGPSTASPRTGTYAARLSGSNSGTSNLSTLSQELPVRAGGVYRLSAWWTNPAAEPITGQCSAQARIEFLDSQRRPLALTPALALTIASPTNTPQQTIVQATAPTAAVWARLVMQYAQIGTSTGAAIVDDVAFSTLLNNSSFDDSGPGFDIPLYDWVPFGGANTSTALARTGPTAARLPAQASGQSSGVFQDFLVRPGQRWQASAWFAPSPADPLTGSARAVVNIEWIDAAGNVISVASNTGLLPGAPASTWSQSLTDAVAPPLAVKGRLVLACVNAAGQPAGGAALADDVSLAQLTRCGLPAAPDSPTCIADHDCSGTIAIDDIFIYLSDWFNRCTGQAVTPCQGRSADVSPGELTIDDIFVFLAAWFARC